MQTRISNPGYATRWSRGFLLCVVVLGLISCSSIRKVENTTERFYRKGFSILPPQESGWQVKDGYQRKVAFYKKGEMPKTSYVVSAYTSGHSINFENEEEFEMVMGKLRISMEFRPKRNVLLEKKVNLAPNIGKYCLKSYSKLKDFGRGGKASDRYYLRENFGLICLHPEDKNRLVNFAISYRYPPGAEDEEIEVKAEEILAGVKLEPLPKRAAP